MPLINVGHRTPHGDARVVNNELGLSVGIISPPVKGFGRMATGADSRAGGPRFCGLPTKLFNQVGSACPPEAQGLFGVQGLNLGVKANDEVGTQPSEGQAAQGPN